MKAELDQGAVAVAHTTAEEDSRPGLTCVRIGNGEVAAADGFMLIRGPAKTEGEGAILVRGKAIIEAQRVFPHGRLLIEQSGDEVVFKSTHHSDLALSAKVVNASFPTLDDKYPTSEPVAFIALSIGLLRKLLDAIPDAAPFIKFRIRKPNDPVEFVAGDTSGIIMPMCTPEQDEHWHKVGKVV